MPNDSFGPPANNGDIDRDVKKELAGFSAKLKEKAAATGLQPPAAEPIPAVTQTAPPAIVERIAAIVAPPTEAPPAKPTASVTPPAEPSTPEQELSTEPKPDQDEPTVPWDQGLLDTPLTEEPLTLDSLSSALKLDKKLKGTNDLVEQFTAQQAKIKELETAREQVLDDIDPELKEVLQVARKKGDWKQYLSTKVVNQNNIDPVTLFNNLVEQDPRFRNPTTGLPDYERVDAELAQIPEAVRYAQGNIMKQNLIAQQDQRRANILREAERKEVEFNRNLAEAAKRVHEVLSQDKFGIKLEPRHSDYLYEGIRNGKLVEKHLGKLDISGIDPSKLIKTLAIAEWGENISKHQLSQGIVQGKKQLLAKSQNVQLNTPVAPPAPNVPDGKGETAADKLRKIHNKPVNSL